MVCGVWCVGCGVWSVGCGVLILSVECAGDKNAVCMEQGALCSVKCTMCIV